jgi:hypothetical protein
LVGLKSNQKKGTKTDICTLLLSIFRKVLNQKPCIKHSRRILVKTKILLFFTILIISLNLAALAYAQTGTVYFKEDFNYSSLDQMQTAGWTFTRPAGISLSAGAVILDGTGGDCAMHYATSFSNNFYNWKTETRSRWLGQGHSVLSVFTNTERHSYGLAADGYYNEFSFYRDSVKILRFGNYAEKANQYVLLTMVRQANTFSFYFNGELINTYTEKDTVSSKVTSLEMVSPWRGDAQYDYYQIGEPTAVFTSSTPTESTSSFPMVPVLVGGGIAAVVIVGIFVYYFVIAGSGAGASAGSTIAGTGVGGSGGASSGGESVIHDHPISPLSGEVPQSPLSGESIPYGSEDMYSNQYGIDYSDPNQSATYDPSLYDTNQMYSPYSNDYYDPNQLGTYDSSLYDLTQMYSDSYANNPSIDDPSAYNLQEIEAQQQAYMQAQSQAELQTYPQNFDNPSLPVPESDSYYNNYASDYNQYPAGTYDSAPYEMNQYLDPTSNNYYDPNQPGIYDSSPYETNDVYTDPYANNAIDQYPAGTYDTSVYEQAQQQALDAQQQAGSYSTP